MAGLASSLHDLPASVPRRRQVSGRDRGDLPFLVPDRSIRPPDEYQRKLSFEITEALAKRSRPRRRSTAPPRVGRSPSGAAVTKQKAQWGREIGRDEGDSASNTTRTGRPRRSSVLARASRGRGGAPVIERVASAGASWRSAAPTTASCSRAPHLRRCGVRCSVGAFAPSIAAASISGWSSTPAVADSSTSG